MSVNEYFNYFNSRNDINGEKEIKKWRKISKTSNPKIPKIKEENIKPHKKIKLKKFLTRIIGYEGKRNLDLEKMRFTKLWKEKNFFNDGISLTNRTLSGRNNNNIIIHFKNKKNINRTFEGDKSKKIRDKLNIKNNKYKEIDKNKHKEIEKYKHKEIEKNKCKEIDKNKGKEKIDKNKYKEKIDKNKKKEKLRTMSNKRMKKFYESQEDWAKYVNDKKDKIKQNILLKNENELNNFFYPQTNRYYNTKYNYEKTLDEISQKNELDIIKKKFMHRKESYLYKPYINYNKCKNITSIYNYSKYKNNKIQTSKNNEKIMNKTDINKKKKTKIKQNLSMQNAKNESVNVNDKSFKIKKNKKINPLKFLNCNINNKKYINNNNIYYLNINQTTSCDTFLNKIIYKRHNSLIDDMILEKIEKPIKEFPHS